MQELELSMESLMYVANNYSTNIELLNHFHEKYKERKEYLQLVVTMFFESKNAFIKKLSILIISSILRRNDSYNIVERNTDLFSHLLVNVLKSVKDMDNHMLLLFKPVLVKLALFFYSSTGDLFYQSVNQEIERKNFRTALYWCLIFSYRIINERDRDVIIDVYQNSQAEDDAVLQSFKNDICIYIFKVLGGDKDYVKHTLITEFCNALKKENSSLISTFNDLFNYLSEMEIESIKLSDVYEIFKEILDNTDNPYVIYSLFFVSSLIFNKFLPMEEGFCFVDLIILKNVYLYNIDEEYSVAKFDTCDALIGSILSCYCESDVFDFILERFQYLGSFIESRNYPIIASLVALISSTCFFDFDMTSSQYSYILKILGTIVANIRVPNIIEYIIEVINAFGIEERTSVSDDVILEVINIFYEIEYSMKTKVFASLFKMLKNVENYFDSMYQLLQTMEKDSYYFNTLGAIISEVKFPSIETYQPFFREALELFEYHKSDIKSEYLSSSIVYFSGIARSLSDTEFLKLDDVKTIFINVINCCISNQSLHPLAIDLLKHVSTVEEIGIETYKNFISSNPNIHENANIFVSFLFFFDFLYNEKGDNYEVICNTILYLCSPLTEDKCFCISKIIKSASKFEVYNDIVCEMYNSLISNKVTPLVVHTLNSVLNVINIRIILQHEELLFKSLSDNAFLDFAPYLIHRIMNIYKEHGISFKERFQPYMQNFLSHNTNAQLETFPLFVKEDWVFPIEEIINYLKLYTNSYNQSKELKFLGCMFYICNSVSKREDTDENAFIQIFNYIESVSEIHNVFSIALIIMSVNKKQTLYINPSYTLLAVKEIKMSFGYGKHICEYLISLNHDMSETYIDLYLSVIGEILSTPFSEMSKLDFPTQYISTLLNIIQNRTKEFNIDISKYIGEEHIANMLKINGNES